MTFIPGMTGAISMTKSLPPLLQTVTKIAHNTAWETAFLPWPVGYTPEEGDLAFYYDWCFVENNGGDPTKKIFAGFTEILNDTANSGESDPPDEGRYRVNLAYRIMTGAEDMEVPLEGMNGNRREGKIMFIFRGDIPIKTVTPKSLLSTMRGETHSRTIPSAAGKKPLVPFAFGAADSGVQVVVNATPGFLEVVNNTVKQTGCYSIYNVTPQNIAISGLGGGGGTGWAFNVTTGFLELA